MDDAGVASLAGNTATGHAFGSTSVRLFDRNSYYDATTQPTSMLHVVKPAILALRIRPHDRHTPGSMYA